VAAKHIHIHRGRVADLFLDTTECNGHTTAADILWSGTPVLTYPRHRHKMCSRVAASIAYATGYGDEMTVYSEQEYEDRAVRYALDTSWEYVTDPTPTPYQNTAATTEPDQPMPPSNARIPAKLQASHLPPITPGLHRRGRGSLINLRMRLFLTRDVSPLFDTPRWTRNLEKGYWEAWRRWATA
jgi:protein O-GlcNAc transferase